jgi:hypothetical protein
MEITVKKTIEEKVKLELPAYFTNCAFVYKISLDESCMQVCTVEDSLYDFDLDELLDEIKHRYYYESKKKEINEWAKELFDIERFNVKLSMLDQMKIDLLMNNINKITLNDLEKLI